MGVVKCPACKCIVVGSTGGVLSPDPDMAGSYASSKELSRNGVRVIVDLWGLPMSNVLFLVNSLRAVCTSAAV